MFARGVALLKIKNEAKLPDNITVNLSYAGLSYVQEKSKEFEFFYTELMKDIRGSNKETHKKFTGFFESLPQEYMEYNLIKDVEKGIGEL